MKETFESKIKNVYLFAQKTMPNHPYHNFNHAQEVYYAVIELSRLEKLNYEKEFLLKTAALLHDVYYSVGGRCNEERSAAIAKQVLQKFGYTNSQIETVSALILSTKLETYPKNVLEKLLHDADLYAVGSDEFFEKSERLRVENGVGKTEWYCEIQPKFLNEFKYHTEAAKKLWNYTLEENLKKMEGYVCS